MTALAAVTNLTADAKPCSARTLSICIISPRFDPSFYGSEYALPIEPGSKRCIMMCGALPALAALVPAGHRVVLRDENIEELDFEELRQFDIIGVTGMIVQKRRLGELLPELRRLPATICAGGPYATCEESFFDGLCDVLFVGEAEETWPQFLRDHAAGRPTQSRYQQAERTDMTKVPTPRFDLTKSKHYVAAPVQFARGCPFMCEFCDIIVMFGRRPRLKTVAQLIAELDAARAAGFRNVFIVDDNFIGNKNEAKKLLRAIIAWQESEGYPLFFTTEASINLADDSEMLDLMFQANFVQVFVGIESPRPKSLAETKKVQNIRGDSIDAKLSRIRDAGLVIMGGFIVGFDNDDERIFDEQFDFIQRNGIAIAGLSVLSPIPTTPLYERLKRDGRLRLDDDLVWFEPQQMSREVLKRGHQQLNARLYTPQAYFERVFNGFIGSKSFRERRRAAQARAVGRRVRGLATLGCAITMARLAATLLREGVLTTIGLEYVRAYLRYNPVLPKAERLHLAQFLSLCARHWHYYKVTNAGRTYWGMPGAEPVNDLRPAPALAKAATG